MSATRQQVSTVKNEWDSIQSDIVTAKNELERCLQHWVIYEQIKDDCNLMIRKTENQLSQSLDLANKKEEKEEMSEKLRALHQDLRSKQMDMDKLSDQAQIIARQCQEKSVTNATSRTMSAYQTLCQKVNESFKRWKQHASEHGDLDEKMNEFSSWMSEIDEQLRDCSSPTADKHSVQRKLDKLGQLVILKTEGSTLIGSVHDAAHSVLPNTSSIGKEEIRTSVQRLQKQWDNILNILNETRTRLENASSFWLLYDESATAVRRYLKETDNGFKQFMSHLPSNLHEKRVLVDRVRLAQANALAQQSNIDTLISRGRLVSDCVQDDTILNEANKLAEEYDMVLDTLREFSNKAEKYVNDHEKYEQLSTDAHTWIQSTLQQLSECRDVCTDRSTLHTRFNKAKELTQMKTIGHDKIDKIEHAALLVLQSTSQSGKDVIEQQLMELKNSLNRLEKDIEETAHKTEKAANTWSEVSDDLEKISTWLNKVDAQLKGEQQSKISLNEKIDSVNHLNELLSEIESKQMCIEQISEKAHSELAGDTKLTSKVSHLAARHAILQTHVVDALKRSQQHVSDHEQFEETLNDAEFSLTQVEKKLDKIGKNIDSDDRSFIAAQIDSLNHLHNNEREISGKIRCVHTWGDKTMATTAPNGSYINLLFSWNNFSF